MMKRPLLFILAVLLPLSPASARLLAITSQQVEALGIRTAPARPAVTQTTVSVLGRIAPAPDSRIPVSAPFAGAVVQLLRLEGETVQKDDPLAVIVSADMHAAMARLKGQEAHYRSAKAAADRARALVSEGIAPASRAEEAHAEAAAAAAELAASRAVMSRAGQSAGSDYRLLAPAKGRITSIEASAGDQVAAMQPMLSIDTRTELWVEGTLPASAIGQVAAGDSVMLEGMPAVTGVVTAAGTSIDPRTRAATVRARLNATAPLVSGQTVRLSILRKAQTGSFQVPRVAIVELKSGPVTFVARTGGFEAIAIQVLARGAQDVTIKGPIRPGDRVAISGVSELKAANVQD
jgi:cobalt-zinc-cadmium efflux system membrane fusion protein